MLYPIHNLLRLCRRQTFLQKKRFNHVRVTSDIETNKNNENTTKKKDFKSLLHEHKDKITFNSYLEHDKLELGHFKYHLKVIKEAIRSQKREYKHKSLPPLPVSLQYFVDKDKLLEEETTDSNVLPEKAFQMPFSKTTNVQYDKSVNTQIPDDTEKEFDKSNMDKWMTNYDYFDDTKYSAEQSDNEEIESDWCKQYGTPDPSIPVSRVACGGCGALLHCSEPSIPGYLPSEIFSDLEVDELKSIECQRCHFLKEYNIALDVSVEAEEYEKLLMSIQHVKSLVLVMVDLLDFPCSIWPGIVDIVGTERPIIIVANKVDLLPRDSIGYLKRVKESLITQIRNSRLADANIKYISLISAKTGYGVEDLISAMFKIWLYKGDVFLVGCTNVGKSSLFNALLQSDYCKVHAVDIVKRATVSRWPGTTLNLLKFPINRPSGWKIYQRSRRLKSEAQLMKVEKEIRKAQLRDKPSTDAPALIGHIGRSFSELLDDNQAEKQRMLVFDDKHKLFVNSKWFFDTPGVIHPDQVLSLLSTEELLVTVPKKVISPQTYYLSVGSSLFIGGLARIDFVESTHPCRFTMFCSETLPITVTKTEHADDVYEKFLGTEIFAVPSGGVERLKRWPGLAQREELFEFVGAGPKECCGDVVLSSIAWVSITAKKDTVCKVRAWTPEARGIHKRCPSILPFAINLRGKRVRDTPAYMIGKPFSDD